MDNPIQIQKIDLQLDKAQLSAPGGGYRLLYVRSGTGELLLNYKRFSIRPRRIFLLSPGTQNLVMEWQGSGWLIAFETWLLRAFFQQHPSEKLLPLFLPGKKPFADVAPASASAVHVLAQLLYQNEQAEGTPKVAYSYLDALLLHMANACRRLNKVGAGKVNYAIAEQLLPLIALHFKTERLPAFYAGQLGVPLRRLNEITRSAMGKLVMELINEQLLSEAERLLAESPLSIKEIAYELNFADMAQFNHFMKRHTGSSPRNFRRQVRG